MPCYSVSNKYNATAEEKKKFTSKELGPKVFSIGADVKFNAFETAQPLLRTLGSSGHDRFGAKKTSTKNVKKQFEQVRIAKPCSKANIQTTIPHKELERIEQASRVVQLANRLDALVKDEQESKRLDMEADLVRQRFKEIDDARKMALNVNVADDKSESEKLKVLERSFLLKHEQEEEIRNVNRIILNAKCHAVRDAQIQERKNLEMNMQTADLRLENIVQERAIKETNAEDELHTKQQLTKAKYANEIRHQLRQREKMRQREIERREEEAKLLREAHKAIKLDEEQQAQLARERRAKFQADMAKVVEMSNMMKTIVCEQEKLADLRIDAYNRERQVREEQLATEKRLAKEAFERRQQRLYTLAQKIFESKSQRDEMDYLREQEKMEREYRQKEQQAVMRKLQIEKQMKEARQVQLHEIKRRQALQIARAEQDFMNLVDFLKLEEQKQNQISVERQKRFNCYRMDIIRQMDDKEMDRRRLIEIERAQANALRESNKQRDANINAIINAKMHAMREACLPDRYIKEVEKQLNRIAPTSNTAK